MTDKSIDSKILYYLHELGKAKQLYVLNYLKGLAKKDQKGDKNKKLLELAGSISKRDLTLMKQAINEGCENVDPNEW